MSDSASAPPAHEVPADTRVQAGASLKAVPIGPAGSGGTTLLGGGVKPFRMNHAKDADDSREMFLVRERDGLRYLLECGKSLSVGRSSRCDIRIDGNTNISRVHLSIRPDGAGAEITDIGSANGTFVKGRRLSKGQTERVGKDERFQIANETFRICE
ncbi:MAG: FHA domain-containing protein [Coriobacteriales bacterium]